MAGFYCLPAGVEPLEIMMTSLRPETFIPENRRENIYIYKFSLKA
jgi:hypothetical protein